MQKSSNLNQIADKLSVKNFWQQNIDKYLQNIYFVQFYLILKLEPQNEPY